jgi:hypothetical protein
MATNDCARAKANAVESRQIANLLLRGMAHSDTSTAIVTGAGQMRQYLKRPLLSLGRIAAKWITSIGRDSPAILKVSGGISVFLAHPEATDRKSPSTLSNRCRM